jgi:hypothetical protein
MRLVGLCAPAGLRRIFAVACRPRFARGMGVDDRRDHQAEICGREWVGAG